MFQVPDRVLRTPGAVLASPLLSGTFIFRVLEHEGSCQGVLYRQTDTRHKHTQPHTPPRDIGLGDRMPISLPLPSLQMRPSLCVTSGWKDVPQSRDEVLMPKASSEQGGSETLGILL